MLKLLWSLSSPLYCALSVIAPVGLLYLQQFNFENNWVTLYPLLLILAYLGGPAAGLIATITSLIGSLFFLEPSVLNFIILFIMGLSISAMSFQNQVCLRKQQLLLRLEQSQRFLDSLLENIPNMVFVKDAKDLKFIRFNKAGEDLLGHDRNSMIGKNDYDFFPPEQASFFIEKDRKVLSGNEIVDIPEETIQTKDKGLRILHTKKIPIYDVNGQAAYLLGIAEDITELKHNEKELLRMTELEGASKEREKHNKVSSFLAEASGVLSRSLDYEKNLQDLTKVAIPVLGDWCIVAMENAENQFERVAAYYKDGAFKSELEKLLSIHRKVPSTSPVVSTIKRNETIFRPEISEDEFNILIPNVDQSALIRGIGVNSYIVVPILSRQKSIGFISFFSASERRYNQEDVFLAQELGRRAGVAIDNSLLYQSAQQAINSRDEFLSIASHELKTPLTSLKLQLQISLKALRAQSSSNDKVLKMMELSNKQIERLTGLVNGLLDVSRISAGKLIIKPETIDLSAVVQDVVSRFEGQLRQGGCKLNLNMTEHLIGQWDILRLEQVVVNLLSNVVKYAPGSQIELCVEREEDYAVLIVRDFGPGIPLDKQHIIFNRFERLGGEAREVSGLGLGLFIVKQIVELHGGQIFVDPKVTDGTKMVVRLPLVSKLLK